MSVFMIDTDSVSGIGSSITSLASQVDSIASGVSGYDTSCEDGFDFAGAKSVIADNIKACVIKISNTGIVIDNVVSSHTSLQSSLVYGAESEETATSSSGSNGYSSGGYSGYSGYSSGGYSGGYSSSTGGYYSDGGYTSGVSDYVDAGEIENPDFVDPTVTENPDTELVEGEEENPDDTINVSEYDVSYDPEEDTHTPAYEDVVSAVGGVTTIGSALLNLDALTEEASSFITESPYSYDDSGFAKIGDMYVISCNSSVGNVGDCVKITLSDGTVIDCVIGDNTLEEDGIKFYVNEEWNEDSEGNITKDLDGNIKTIVNCGTGQTSGYISMTNVPAIGENTEEISKLDDEWVVASTKISLSDYEKVIDENDLSQDADMEKYDGSCLGFSYMHASNLYNGTSDDSIKSAEGYKYADQFDSFYTDNKDEALKLVYSEVLRGKPVIMQVNGNEEGSTAHFVTVVGFRKGIDDASKLTEKDLLIIDSFDGHVERMDQSGSRFMTTGSQVGKDYGYYLRFLKNQEEENA